MEIRNIPGKGRGVFTDAPFLSGDCVERSPVIEIPAEQIVHIRRTELHNYFFKWGKDRKDAALALGYGSLYNHSYDPNAEFIVHLEERVIGFYALRPIEPGEEITVNYNGDPEDRSRIWFDPV